MHADDVMVSVAEVWEPKKRIRGLERVLVRKPLRNEILTEAAKLTYKKADLVYVIASNGKYLVLRGQIIYR